MRIAFNCHALVPPFTGVQQSMVGMLKSLASECDNNKGNDEILSYIPWGLKKEFLPELEKILYRRSWAKCGNRTMRIVWEQFSLFRKAGRDGAGVLIAPCYVMPLWSTVPVLLNVHDCFAFTHPQFCTGSNRSHFRQMMPESIKRAAMIVTPTNAVKRDILDTFKGITPDKIEAVPWGVDEIFQPVTDVAELDRVKLAYGLPPKYVLHVGRREPKKNIMQLVQAFFTAVMAEQLPHRLVLVGPKGWGVKGLEKLIEELGITDRVIFLDYIKREDMPAIYTLADAFAFPSMAEGFGLPVLESMACGTPVVASNLRSLREVCGGAAQLVEEGSLPSLREGLEKVLTNAESALELSEKGLARAREFSWKNYAQKIMSLCRKIAGEK